MRDQNAFSASLPSSRSLSRHYGDANSKGKLNLNPQPQSGSLAGHVGKKRLRTADTTPSRALTMSIVPLLSKTHHSAPS